MTQQLNLNADMGEGFGAYDIGNDAEILRIIKSASVACGFHAGDPNVMHRVVHQAKENGVSVGAHPGFNDVWGFGRRQIHMDPNELELLIAYQIGALQAMAAYAGVKVTHLKPHGALNNMAATDADLALAIGRAIKTVDRDIIYVALANSEMEHAARKLDLPVAREGFVDRWYDDDGNLTSRKIPGSVIENADEARDRVMSIVEDQVIVSRTGKRMHIPVDTLCVHGDEQTGVAMARVARETLESAGVDVVPLPQMKLGS